MLFRIRVFLALFLITSPAFAQDRSADLKIAFARAQHLRHGINASGWFAQNPGHYSAQYTNTETTPADIAAGRLAARRCRPSRRRPVAKAQALRPIAVRLPAWSRSSSATTSGSAIGRPATSRC